MTVIMACVVVVTSNATLYNINVDTWLNDSSLYGGTTTISTTGGTSWRNVYAGQFEANFVGTPAPGYNQSFLTYCTDINNWLDNGYYRPVSWEPFLAPHNPPWDGSVGWVAASSIFTAWRNNVDSNAEAIGVQLAIWDALYDGGDGWNSGTFRSTIDFATYLRSPNGQILSTPTSIDWWMPTYSDGTYREAQGLMGNVAVPEPSTLLAGVCLFLPFAAATFRRGYCRKNRVS